MKNSDDDSGEPASSFAPPTSDEPIDQKNFSGIQLPGTSVIFYDLKLASPLAFLASHYPYSKRVSFVARFELCKGCESVQLRFSNTQFSWMVFKNGAYIYDERTYNRRGKEGGYCLIENVRQTKYEAQMALQFDRYSSLVRLPDNDQLVRNVLSTFNKELDLQHFPQFKVEESRKKLLAGNKVMKKSKRA